MKETITHNGYAYHRNPPTRNYFTRYIEDNGKKYTLHLHKKIWEETWGLMEDNEVIHHIDGNPINNDMDNLKCMSQSEHLKLHRSENAHEVICAECGTVWKTTRLAPVNFCSDVCWHRHRSIIKICEVCKKEFKACNGRKHQLFCSFSCSSKNTWKNKRTKRTKLLV